MVGQARDAWNRLTEGSETRRKKVSFEVGDVMNIAHEKSSFDLIICNRLFHHFSESSTRVRALTELGRVTKRWVIVSFFNADTLDAKRKRLGQMLTGRRPTTRRPIPFDQFTTDAAAAGLRVVRSFPTRGRISPQWYVLLERC